MCFFVDLVYCNKKKTHTLLFLRRWAAPTLQAVTTVCLRGHPGPFCNFTCKSVVKRRSDLLAGNPRASLQAIASTRPTPTPISIRYSIHSIRIDKRHYLYPHVSKQGRRRDENAFFFESCPAAEALTCCGYFRMVEFRLLEYLADRYHAHVHRWKRIGYNIYGKFIGKNTTSPAPIASSPTTAAAKIF